MWHCPWTVLLDPAFHAGSIPITMCPVLVRYLFIRSSIYNAGSFSIGMCTLLVRYLFIYLSVYERS